MTCRIPALAAANNSATLPPSTPSRHPMQKHKKGRRPARVEATIDRITGTTLNLMLKQGADSLSISEICREAAVARPTLYRHFPTLDAVLEGVFLRIKAEFDRGLAEAIGTDPDPARRARILADYLDAHLRSGRTQQLFISNPQFSIALIGRFFDNRAALYREILDPYWDLFEGVTGSRVDREEAARLLNHYYVSLNIQTAVGSPSKDPGGNLLRFIRMLGTLSPTDRECDKPPQAREGK